MSKLAELRKKFRSGAPAIPAIPAIPAPANSKNSGNSNDPEPETSRRWRVLGPEPVFVSCSPAATLDEILEHRPDATGAVSFADLAWPLYRAGATCSSCRHWWRHPDQATTGDCLRNHFATNAGDDCRRYEALLGSAYRPEVKQ